MPVSYPYLWAFMLWLIRGASVRDQFFRLVLVGCEPVSLLPELAEECL